MANEARSALIAVVIEFHRASPRAFLGLRCASARAMQASSRSMICASRRVTRVLRGSRFPPHVYPSSIFSYALAHKGRSRMTLSNPTTRICAVRNKVAPRAGFSLVVRRKRPTPLSSRIRIVVVVDAGISEEDTGMMFGLVEDVPVPAAHRHDSNVETTGSSPTPPFEGLIFGSLVLHRAIGDEEEPVVDGVEVVETPFSFVAGRHCIRRFAGERFWSSIRASRAALCACP